MSPRPATVALIGAPTDIGAGHRGASMGPEALRVARLGEALMARGVEVADRGNLSGPYNPWLPPSAALKSGVTPPPSSVPKPCAALPLWCASAPTASRSC